jgi:hypothetical protein
MLLIYGAGHGHRQDTDKETSMDMDIQALVVPQLGGLRLPHFALFFYLTITTSGKVTMIGERDQDLGSDQ